MSFTAATHLHIASLSVRFRVRRLALLALAVVGVIALALALVSTWADGHATQAGNGLSSAAVDSPAGGQTAPGLPVSYRSVPPSKLAALGIVRNPRTGQWMCIRVPTHRAAPNTRHYPVAFRP